MTIQETIKQQMNDHTVVLYMKGTPVFPQCGFSAKAVQLLQQCLEPLKTDTMKVLYVNVLENTEIREGIKQYGQWPTIPQLYIRGELMGGSDIIEMLFNSGELQKQIAAAFIVTENPA